MKKTILLLTAILALALLLASCEKKPATQAQPPAQADTPALSEVAEPTAPTASAGFTEEAVPEPYWVWVKTDDGSSLNMRDAPKHGDVTGKMYDGYSAKVLKLTAEKDTIGGITERWCYVRCEADIEPYFGWVFGGYLYGYASDDAYHNYTNLLDSYIFDTDKAYPEGEIVAPQKEYSAGTVVRSVTDTALYTADRQTLPVMGEVAFTVKEVFRSEYDIIADGYAYPYYIVRNEGGGEGIISGIYLTDGEPQPTASAGGYAYSGSDDIDNVAWYGRNSGGATHEVMTKAPNALGLYDMSGNVSEWCWDWHKGGYYAKSPAENPRGTDSGKCRVLRGGSWDDGAAICRVDCRNCDSPSFSRDFLGFRVARSAKESQPAPSGFALVEGGSFRMGSEDGTGDDDEHPAHTVSVDGFYMATHEVTQEEYERVTDSTPSAFARGGSYPVESVSWYDAVFYCNLRSKQEGLEPCYYVLAGNERVYIDSWQDFSPDQSGEYLEIHCDWSANGYRLPTEAEWEYAARGGRQRKVIPPLVNSGKMCYTIPNTRT